jgi:hypothetical protein
MKESFLVVKNFILLIRVKKSKVCASSNFKVGNVGHLIWNIKNQYKYYCNGSRENALMATYNFNTIIRYPYKGQQDYTKTINRLSALLKGLYGEL